MRLRNGQRGIVNTAAIAAVHCSVLALPILFILAHGSTGSEGPSWNLIAKVSWLASLFRERWKFYDVICAFVPIAIVWAGIRDRRLSIDPLAGAGALLCFAAFLVLPRLMVGGSYVDMRMFPSALAIALVAIRVRPGHAGLERALALAGAAFYAMRTATTTAAMLLFAQVQQQALEVVPSISRGSAVLVLVNEPCSTQWSSRRLGHIAGIALARRDIFENGQWALPGQQLIQPRHSGAAPYLADPSQLVYPASCDYRTTDFTQAVRDFDRTTFDFVWTLDFPARARLAPDVTLVWSNGVSALYRVAPQPRLRRSPDSP